MKQAPEPSRTPTRRDMEIILLKALIWKSSLTPHIMSSLSTSDFAPPSRAIYSALLNMIAIGIEVRAKTLQDALETPIDLPLFDKPPHEKDVAMCLEFYRHRSTERKKAVGRIMEWKKSIDSYTQQLNEGDMDPHAWVDRIGALIPVKKEEGKASPAEKSTRAPGQKADEEPGAQEEEKEAHSAEGDEEPAGQKEIIGSVDGDWEIFLKEFERGPEKELSGLRTGMIELDKKSLGLKGLMVLTGMPKMGKTTLALQLATEIARLNSNALSIFYSLEMDRKSLLARILSRIAMLPYATLLLSRLPKLREQEVERYRKATKSFNSYKNRVMLVDRTTTEISTDQVYYQVDNLLKKTKKGKVFIVVDTLVSLSYLSGEGDRPDVWLHQIERLVGKFRLVQQLFNATILLIYPKNYSSLLASDNISRPNRCYDLVYSVDSFFEMYNKSEAKTPTDYYSEMSIQDEEIDIWATCRDTGQWYVPLTFTKACFLFSMRKSGFKATRISWTPPEEEEEEPLR